LSTASASLSKTTKIRLLYVDDEVDILHIVQKGLFNHGFAVDICANPEDVLRLNLSQYEMIVLDLRMPKLSGFELYEKIKSKIDPAKTKVCFFTAYTSYLDEYNRKFPNWKGCHFMTKPMSTKILAEKLHALMREK